MVTKTTEHALEGREFFQLLSTGKYENLTTVSCQIILPEPDEKYNQKGFLFYFF